jgi:hypothetical protein
MNVDSILHEILVDHSARNGSWLIYDGNSYRIDQSRVDHVVYDNTSSLTLREAVESLKLHVRKRLNSNI